MLMWPGDGVMLALMLGPCRRTPFMMAIVGEVSVLAMSLVFFALSHGYNPRVLFDISVMGAVVFGRVILTYGLTKRLLGSTTTIHSKGLVTFLVAAAASSIVGAILKTGISAAEGHRQLVTLFTLSVTATLVGYAVLTPPLLILMNRGLMNQAVAAFKIRHAVIALMLTPAVMVALFGPSRYPVLYLAPLVLMAVAYTVDLFTLALAALMSCLLMSGLFIAGHGPAYLIQGSPLERLLFMQAFLVIVAATTLPIAALMAEYALLKESLVGARIEAEAANQAKGVFLATMSHEIRTPLNGVLGMAQVIAMGELPPPQRERLQVLHRSGEALLTLLNDVLDLSKIEAGKLVMETVEFDLGELLGEAARNYRVLALDKGLAFDFDIGDAGGTYLGDPNRLRQIVYNLVANALKFTHRGSISMAARFNEGRLRIEVTDTGIGIPADKLDKLFVKFSQVDESTTRNFGGTGLGLSICRELAELMGGHIVVYSAEGKGSCFTLDIPLPRVATPRQAFSPNAPTVPPDTGAIQVLAAEDNPTNRLVLKTLLDIAGAQLTLVENGAEAVKAWSRQPWDIILMDVQMPVMDGLAATREIRKREVQSGRPRTPVIALTASTLAHQIAEYFDAGMDAHVAKPIEAQYLFQTISSLVDTARAATDAPETRLSA